MPEDKLKRLQGILKVIDDTPSKEDFIAAFKAVAQIFQAMKSDNEKERVEILRLVRSSLNELEKRISSMVSGKDGAAGRDGRDGVDGKDGKNPRPEEVVPLVIRALPKEQKPTGDDLITDINSYRTQKVIKKERVEGFEGLERRVSQLESRPITIQGVSGGGSASGGRIVKSYDLSGSLDGSTKTFSLPAFYRIISVHLSSVPNILRETTDYTFDPNLMTITFTDEINASTSLASGQTLVIVYAEI